MIAWAPVPLALAIEPRVLVCSEAAQALLARLYLQALGSDYVPMPQPTEAGPDDSGWRRLWGDQLVPALHELAAAGLIEVERGGLRLTIQTPPFPLSDDQVRLLPRRAWVYAIGPLDGDVIKIGSTVSPWERLQTLQTSHPERLAVFALMPGGVREERALHREFAEHRVRASGEWFRLAPQVIRWCKQWWGVGR